MRTLQEPSFANFWYLTFDFELATECPRINSSFYRTLKDAAQLLGRIFSHKSLVEQFFILLKQRHIKKEHILLRGQILFKFKYIFF
jgi:hypothetical protein